MPLCITAGHLIMQGLDVTGQSCLADDTFQPQGKQQKQQYGKTS